MDKPIVAVVQHKLIISKSLDELLVYYHRFLRIAKTKGSRLIVFPEYSGLAVGVPMFSGWRNALLKEAATPKSGLLPRLKGMLAGGAANVMRADLQKSLRLTLSQMPESLFDIYVSVFSELAKQYEMTIVAGSLYAYDVESGAIRNASYIFGPDGSLLGQQAQVVLEPETLDLAQSATGWQAIDTPVGRIGLLFGPEALYPEPARVLAYQGAEMLITIAAAKRPATYHKIRQGALARCQENQLYGLVSFLAGPDPFAAADTPVFMGKSAIFAPLDFTPRFTGVMTELGSAQAEGVITAEWDYPALHQLWAASETPIRRRMPLEQVGLLAQVYGRALTLDASQQTPLLGETAAEQAESVPKLAAPAAISEPEDEMAQEVNAEEVMTGEEDILSMFTPILPTEPNVISLAEPDTNKEAPTDENTADDVEPIAPASPPEADPEVEDEIGAAAGEADEIVVDDS